MKYNPEKHHRQSIRLKNYDYSQDGCYYITICTYNREELFGKIRRRTTRCALFEIGIISEKFWQEIPTHFPYVELDEYIIMPNHIHGILILNRGVQHVEPLRNKYQKIIPGSIGSIIRGYKASVTKWIRQNTDIYMVWQRNYHDHIIKHTKELNHIRKYIIENHRNWTEDENNPINIRKQ